MVPAPFQHSQEVLLLGIYVPGSKQFLVICVVCVSTAPESSGKCIKNHADDGGGRGTEVGTTTTVGLSVSYNFAQDFFFFLTNLYPLLTTLSGKVWGLGVKLA